MAKGKVKAKIQQAAQNVKASVNSAANAVKSGATNAAVKVQTAVQNVPDKVKEAAKNTAVKAANAAEKVKKAGVKAASFTMFLPVKPLALLFLKNRGVKPAKENSEIIAQVFEQIKKKSFGFEGDTFDEVLASYQQTDSFGMIPITPEMVIMVVQFLTTVFQAIKAKKAAGEKLTEEEQAIADSAPEIDKALQEAKLESEAILADADKKAGEIEEKGAMDALSDLGGGSVTKIVVIVILLVLVLFFVLRARK